MSHDLGQRDDVTGADDLTRIEGIGPRRAERLTGAGIATYAGLASSSGDEIAKVLPDVSPAKIGAWRDKAGKLARAAATQAAATQAAATQAAADSPADPDALAGDGQRYESVLVRILLNEDGSVRRMTARHIRTGTERHWPTLDREALPGFIETAIAAAAPSANAPAEARRPGAAG